MNGKHEYARSAVLISAFKIRLLDSMTRTAKMKANISQEATTHSTKLKHAQWMLIHFLKQSWQCKGYTHLHTPSASCEILKTEQHPPHSYHILKLRQSNNTAQKTLSHEWDKQTPSKKALLATSAPPNGLILTSNKHRPSSYTNIYLWPCPHMLDADGACRYSGHSWCFTWCLEQTAQSMWQKTQVIRHMKECGIHERRNERCH